MSDLDVGAGVVSVVVPTKNAATLIQTCLDSIRRNEPGEVIIVDGLSEDETVKLAKVYASAILTDGGRGVALARQLGAEMAKLPYVAFVDADVELPEEALRCLLEELDELGVQGIQAGLVSSGAGDYWSEALAAHHNGGRSRRWFGLSATMFVRDEFLRFGLDPAFVTGEDVEMRYRLERAKVRVSVSSRTVVTHRFAPGFRFALDQWLADGRGLGRVVRKHGWRASKFLLVPLAAAVLGAARCLVRHPKFIPYYLMFLFFNYVGISQGVLDGKVRGNPAVEEKEDARSRR